MSIKNLSSLFPTAQVSDVLSGRITVKNNTDPFGQPMYDPDLARKVYRESLTFIQRATPSGSSTATFSTIPTTYSHLMIRAHIFHSTSAATGYQLYFNGENTGTKYNCHRFYCNASASVTYSTNANTAGIFDIGVTYGSTHPGMSIILIGDYNSSSKSKSAIALWSAEADGTGEVGQTTGFWNDVSAITSVSVKTQSGGSFGAGTLIDLYGVA